MVLEEKEKTKKKEVRFIVKMKQLMRSLMLVEAVNRQ